MREDDKMTIRLKDRRKPWQKDLINFTVSLCGTVVRERVGKDLDRRRQLALPLLADTANFKITPTDAEGNYQ